MFDAFNAGSQNYPLLGYSGRTDGFNPIHTGEVCKNTFKTSPISAATYDFPSYPAALTGQQIIPAADIPLTGPQARPSYVMTKWIIRVK